MLGVFSEGAGGQKTFTRTIHQAEGRSSGGVGGGAWHPSGAAARQPLLICTSFVSTAETCTISL